jgi:cytochrome c biogenesis protein CcmG/thiol:disulfide interchange protein DsbE
MAMKKYVLTGVFLAVLAVAAFLSNSQNTGGDDRKTGGQSEQQKAETVAVMPETGYRAPDFVLQTQDGQTVKLSEQLKEKPVVINFWASWCGPCRAEMPDLETVYQKYKDRVNFYVLNLTSQDDLAAAQAFLVKYGVNIPMLTDPDGTVQEMYNILSIPTTFAVKKDGIISEKRQGAMSESAMVGMVERLLK